MSMKNRTKAKPAQARVIKTVSMGADLKSRLDRIARKGGMTRVGCISKALDALLVLRKDLVD